MNTIFMAGIPFKYEAFEDRTAEGGQIALGSVVTPNGLKCKRHKI